jgi:Mn2+/Fe2+ NRAMP family transporter
VTHFVTELHYYLHLPSTIGFFIVGVAGAGLLALIVGGLLSHPRILKDAFHLRLRGAKRLSLTDLHNRLGVWAAPFHFVIALTGAMIGLGQVLFFLMALAGLARRVRGRNWRQAVVRRRRRPARSWRDQGQGS